MVNKEMAVAAIFGAASRLGYSLTEDPPRPLITRGQLWFWFKMAIFAYFMFFMVLGHAAHAGELLFPKSLKPSKVCGPQGTELCTGRELTELRERIKVLWFQSSDNVEYRCALMPSDFSLAKCLLMLNLEEENDAKN